VIAAALPLGPPAASAGAASAVPAADVTGPPPGGVPGVPVPTIRWADAGEGYQQATADVPYDYAHPRGKQFRLQLVRLRASDPAHKIGSLFVNFGGPGGTAAREVRSFGKFLFPRQVLARYDLVGVDPRGTGGSLPVRCFATTRAQQSLPYASGAKFPVTRAQETEAVAENRRFAQACQARNGDLLDHVGTLPFARDLDVLRAALGDRRINLYGLSYGTFLGQVLANLFPTRTGAIVLDAVVDPDWAAGRAGSISWTREGADFGSWQTLQRFFVLCAQAGPLRCAFAAGGDPQRKYAQLATRLRATPLLIPVPGKRPYRVGYSELVGVTISTLYVGPQWPALGRLLQAADTGDVEAVAKAVRELTPPVVPGYDNYRDAQKTILCGDTDNPRDPLRYRQVGQHRDSTVAPYAGSLFAYLALTCAFWRGQATERYTGPWTAHTRTPILILGNRYDPATPYRNAVKVSGLLPNSRLLTVDGVGHGSLLSSTCAGRLIARYLLTGETPRPGTVCRQVAGPFDAASPQRAVGRPEPGLR
jgi:pimeloyl-ACP methyl ester carboxylesterase